MPATCCATTPLPGDILALGQEGLAHLLKKVSRGALKHERAQALYRAAATSIGIQEGCSSILLELGEHVSLVERCEDFIAHLEQQMRHFLGKVPYSGYILSIKGIATVTCASLIAEVGDLRNFSSAEQIIKYAGLDLYEVSSGMHRGKKRISKRGRPLLRKLLYFAAVNTVRAGGIMHEHYARCRERGMARTKALIAISRKLVRIIFALVRDESVYRQGYCVNQRPVCAVA